MTIDYQTKEAKIKELIANATSPRDKAFYEGLLKKAIAERPKQIVEVVKAKTSEHNDKEVSVAERENPSISLESGQSTHKQKKQSASDSQDKSLATETNSSVKQTLEADKEKPKSESKSKSEQKSNAASKKKPKNKPEIIFQAIGVIKGLVVYSEEKLKIQIEGKEYELHSTPLKDKRKNFEGMKQEVKERGSCEKVLVVYPFVNYFKSEEGQKRAVVFRVVIIKEVDANIDTWNELREREFKLSGLWLYMGEEPCIVIRRNWSESLERYVKKASQHRKAKTLKPSYLPVEWSDAPVEAFRYSQSLKLEGKKPDFVSVKTVFLPELNKFKVIEQLAKPSKRSPRYLSAHTKN